MLNQFKGKISIVLTNGNVDFETSIFECFADTSITSINLGCYLEKFTFNSLNQDSWGSQYLMKYTTSALNPKYYVQGWFKLDQYDGIELVTQLLRITINFDYSDDLMLGDRDLQLNIIKTLMLNKMDQRYLLILTHFHLKQGIQHQKNQKLKLLGLNINKLLQIGIIFVMKLELKMKIIILKLYS